THRTARRRRVMPTTCLVLASAVSLTIAACGDDDKPATTAAVGTTVDKAAYIKAGNALCIETGAAIEVAFPDFAGEPTVEQVMQLGADLKPVLESFRAGVTALAPPTDLADKHQTLLDTLGDSIDTLASMAASKEGAQAAIDAGGPPLDEPSTAANAIFPDCPPGDA
ncbi:MAG: hypothetical protein ACKV2O_04515, partial [Acidimicrobiales bacterium]